MKAKLFDGSTVDFCGSDIEDISIEVGDRSILILWKDGNVERAESVSI